MRAPRVAGLAMSLVLLLSAVMLVAPAEGAPVSVWDGHAVLRATTASVHNDADGDGVFDGLESSLLEGDQPAIVVVRYGLPVGPVADAARLMGVQVDAVYDDVGMLAVHLDAVQAKALAAMPAVRQVEGEAKGTPELATSAANVGARYAHSVGFDGSGVTVGIFDTGFDVHDPAVKDRFAEVNGFGTKGWQGHAHGTRVAKIIAGTPPDRPQWNGLAPGATLYGFEIGMDQAKRNTIAAIEWILDHPEAGIDVINISYGMGESVDGTDATELAFDVLWERGIVTFSSNGNEGPDPGHVTVPSGSHGALGIGSLADGKQDGFTLSDYSSRGILADGRMKPDFMAPGGWIDVIVTKSGQQSISTDSGTSFASPFAAGIAATVLSAAPEMSNQQLVDALRLGAVDWGRPGADIEYGHGQLDAARAIAAATGRPMDAPYTFGHISAADGTSFTASRDGSVLLSLTGPRDDTVSVRLDDGRQASRTIWDQGPQKTFGFAVKAGNEYTLHVVGGAPVVDMTGPFASQTTSGPATLEAAKIGTATADPATAAPSSVGLAESATGSANMGPLVMAGAGAAAMATIIALATSITRLRARAGPDGEARTKVRVIGGVKARVASEGGSRADERPAAKEGPGATLAEHPAEPIVRRTPRPKPARARQRRRAPRPATE